MLELASQGPATDSEPSRSPPAILIRNLSKRFGWRWALREIDLRVDRGTVVALLGPNGAGKTTLLRILATLLRPSSGTAEVFGHSVVGEGESVRARTGLLTASGYLYDDLTGAENLRFAALMSGCRADRDRILRALEGVGLATAADLRVRAYSSGMRKRLELARLLLRRVELLLLDEPYASLDAAGIRLVDRVIEQARTDGGTVVLASHRRGDAVRRADLLAVLSGGRLLASGPPETVTEALREAAGTREIGVPWTS